MRTRDGFILGAITGAAIVWFWRREIEDYARDKTRGVRTQVSGGTLSQSWLNFPS